MIESGEAWFSIDKGVVEQVPVPALLVDGLTGNSSGDSYQYSQYSVSYTVHHLPSHSYSTENRHLQRELIYHIYIGDIMIIINASETNT